MSIRTLCCVTVAALALIGGGCAPAAAAIYTAPVMTLEWPSATMPGHPAPLLSAPCEEDEPCWDCETMGNRICGPEIVERWHFGPVGTGSAGPIRPTP